MLARNKLTMSKLRIVNDIIFLPKTFRSQGNVSFYALLEKSGYFQRYDEISEADIYNELAQNLECVDQWLLRSADQRCNGWYFQQKDGKFIVGYCPPQKIFETTEYVDGIEACATYIKREIENIRGMRR